MKGGPRILDDDPSKPLLAGHPGVDNEKKSICNCFRY